MILFFLFGLIAVLCFLLVIYPYMIYPVILKRLPGRSIAARPGFTTSITLAFCAYNEERAMPEKIENLAMLKARHPSLEILAFDDGSADATVALLEARPELLTVVRGAGRSGKAHGMKLLAARATGDIMVFTDANVTLAPDAIDNLMAYYADATVGGVCGSLIYLGEDDSATAAMGSAYWKLEEYLKKEESRTGNVMGADGSIFSIRRTLYPTFPDTVLDDLTVSMAVVFAGHRLIKVEDVTGYERLVTKRGEEFNRKVRIAARAFHTHLFLVPQLRGMTGRDRFKYVSRKLVRWFGGLFLILGVISGLVAVAALSILGALTTILVAAAVVVIGVWKTSGILSSLLEIVIALLATLLGVIRAIRGKTYSVWSPAKSR